MNFLEYTSYYILIISIIPKYKLMSCFEEKNKWSRLSRLNSLKNQKFVFTIAYTIAHQKGLQHVNYFYLQATKNIRTKNNFLFLFFRLERLHHVHTINKTSNTVPWAQKICFRLRPQVQLKQRTSYFIPEALLLSTSKAGTTLLKSTPWKGASEETTPNDIPPRESTRDPSRRCNCPRRSSSPAELPLLQRSRTTSAVYRMDTGTEECFGHRRDRRSIPRRSCSARTLPHLQRKWPCRWWRNFCSTAISARTRTSWWRSNSWLPSSRPRRNSTIPWIMVLSSIIPYRLILVWMPLLSNAICTRESPLWKMAMATESLHRKFLCRHSIPNALPKLYIWLMGLSIESLIILFKVVRDE